MSLLTRLIGFGLCLLGTFTAGYYPSLHATATTVGGVVTNYAASTPDFNSAILADIATYIQQTVPAAWASYEIIGVLVAIGGAIIVAIGDRRPMSP